VQRRVLWEYASILAHLPKTFYLSPKSLHLEKVVSHVETKISQKLSVLYFKPPVISWTVVLSKPQMILFSLDRLLSEEELLVVFLSELKISNLGNELLVEGVEVSGSLCADSEE
jgi:hypothetical protein